MLLYKRKTYKKWSTCYDFETYQRNFREGINQVEELDSEEGTSWNKTHDPVSFSMGCNGPYSSFRLKTRLWGQHYKILNNFDVTTGMLFVTGR